MKSKLIKLGFLMMLMMPMSMMAQEKHQGKPEGCEKPKFETMPGMTAELQTKIDALRIPHLIEMKDLENKMGELRAKQHTLTTSETYDAKAVNANIDDITKLQNQMMKLKAAHRQEVRLLLNPEQRLWFDTHGDKGPGHGKGKGHGSENGHCKEKAQLK